MGNRMSADMEEGLYFISTMKTHEKSKSYWGLTVGLPNKTDFPMLRDSNSAWVYVHKDSKYRDTIWKVSKANGKNRWKISVYRGPTYSWGMYKKFGKEWSLGTSSELRNGSSTWTIISPNDDTSTEWIIEPQETDTEDNLYKIATVNKISGHNPPQDMRMAMWHSSDGYRNSESAKIGVHTGDLWPINWKFKRYYIPGTINAMSYFKKDDQKMKFTFSFKAAKKTELDIVRDKNYKFTLRFYQNTVDIYNNVYEGDNKNQVSWSPNRPDANYLKDVQNGKKTSPTWFTVTIKDTRKTFDALWKSSRLLKTLKMQVEIEITDNDFTKLADKNKWKTSITKDVILYEDNAIPNLTNFFYFMTYT